MDKNVCACVWVCMYACMYASLIVWVFKRGYVKARRCVRVRVYVYVGELMLCMVML